MTSDYKDDWCEEFHSNKDYATEMESLQKLDHEVLGELWEKQQTRKGL